MAGWEQVIAHYANNIEEHFDHLKLRLREKLGIGPVQLLPYRGHGTHRDLYLRGRAVEDYSVISAKDNDSYWQNLLNLYRRFASRELPHARVRAQFGTVTQEVQANEEGFFEVHLHLDQPLETAAIWHDVNLELVDYADQPTARATGHVMIPPHNAHFGVISDLDDTVIQTDMLHLTNLARNTFLRNARTRLPFPGVAEFYQALHFGPDGVYNPLYYVSNSPWNLYDLLVDFFSVRGIPPGAFFLLDLGLTGDHLFRPDGFEHKVGTIELLLNTNPRLSFLLIGDSGEKDPEIYLEVLRRHPGRILAVYIRDVADKRRDEQIVALARQADAVGAEMLLVPDTVAAAVHAAEHGWISPDALPAIRQERREDTRPPEPVEKVIDAIAGSPTPERASSDQPDADAPSEAP